MLRLLKNFIKTDDRPLSWAVWFILTVFAVLIYGFAVGGSLSVACLCILWCVVSAADILLSARSRDNTFLRKMAYALLKGFGAVLLAIILYSTLNRISPTLVTNYDTLAESVEYAKGGKITVTFTDPNGQKQTGEMPDYGCLANEDSVVAVGDGITVAEYEGLFHLTYRTVTAKSEKGREPS